MSDTVEVSHGAIRKENPVFNFVVRLFTDCPIDGLLPPGSIVKMNALQSFVPGQHAFLGIETVDAIPFFG